MPLLLLIALIILGLLIVYGVIYFFLQRALAQEEQRLLSLFLLKTAKIPALIEVMRPYVVDSSAFNAITEIHSLSMVQRAETLYDLLENNARIEHEFLFLMQLSMRIPELQKNEYFLYIRDFIIKYERDIHGLFSSINLATSRWNKFVQVKNFSLIGLILPGKSRSAI